MKMTNTKAWGALMLIALLITGFTLAGVLLVYWDIKLAQQISTVILGFFIGICISILLILRPLGQQQTEEGGKDV